MTKKEYDAKRAQMMNEVKQFLDAGNTAEAEAKMKEVEALDDKWESHAQAMANYAALNKEPKAMSPMSIEDAFGNDDAGTTNSVVDTWASENYYNAWAKDMLGKPKTAKEEEAFKMVNEAYTHTTQNTGVVIPKSVTVGIWEIAGEMYPYFNDIAKTNVNGVLSMVQEDASSDAGWYEEDTATEDGKETLKEFTLGGCELSRSITVAWKLKEMAIEDFVPYIQRKMAKKMGAAAGYGVTHGKGTAVDGKPEPTGVVTALLAETETPQVVTYSGIPTYEQIVAARSKVKSGYGQGLAIYANSDTIWNKIAIIVDKAGRPLFVPDPTNNGTFRVLGMAVKEDDSMLAGEILMSNADQGYHANINKEMSILPEEHVKDRKTDYCGYSIMDGNVTTTKAHALLTDDGAVG